MAGGVTRVVDVVVPNNAPLTIGEPTIGVPEIAFGTSLLTLPEGDSGVSTITNVINVDRKGVTGALLVNLVYAGTAQSGTDYATPPTTATIGSGQNSTTFNLLVMGDPTVELDETVAITATLDAYPSAVAVKNINITNDDVAPPAESLRPGAGWAGVAGSGLAPSDPTRSTAKPTLKSLQPPFTVFTVQGGYLMAESSAEGGVKEVRAHCEGIVVVRTAPEKVTYVDAAGVSREQWCYKFPVDYEAFTQNGSFDVYYEAVPEDTSMQSRVIGPFRHHRNPAKHDLQLTVDPGQAASGNRYQTIAAAVNAAKLAGALRPRIETQVSGTYDFTAPTNKYTGTVENWVTIEGKAGTICTIGRADTSSPALFRPQTNGLRFGPNVVIDLANMSQIYPETTDYMWFDTAPVVNSRGRLALVDQAPRADPIRSGSATGVRYYTTDNYFDGHTQGPKGFALGRNFELRNVAGDCLTGARHMSNFKVINQDCAWFRTPVNAATVTYVGASASATIERAGETTGAFSFTLREAGVAVLVITGSGTPGSGNYKVSDVVNAINAYGNGWSATLQDDTRFAQGLLLAGDTSVGTPSFTAQNAKSITVQLGTAFDVHADGVQYQNNTAGWENVLLVNGEFRDTISAQVIFQNNAQGVRDFHIINVVADSTSGDSSWQSSFGATGGTSSHFVVWNSSFPFQNVRLYGTFDDYCSIKHNIFAALNTIGNPTVAAGVVDDNVLLGGSTNPAWATNTVALASAAAVFTDAVNNDFRIAPSGPAAALLRNSLVAQYLDNSARGTTSLFGAAPSGEVVLAESTAPLQKSISFGPKNGILGQRRALAGPAVATFFGTTAVAGVQPGAVLIRAQIDKGMLQSALGGGTTTAFLNQNQTILGSAGSTGAFNMMYYAADSSTTAARNRVQMVLKDLGSTTSILLQSAVWLDDEPRLIAVRCDGTNFTLDLVRMDGTIDAGVPVPVSTYRGANIAAITLGSWTGATQTFANHWSGSLSDFTMVRNRHVTDAELAAIGKGRSPVDMLPSSNIARYYAMRGASDLAQTAGVDTAAALTTSNLGTDLALADGQCLSGSYDGAQGLVLVPLILGYTAGLPKGSPNGSRPIPVSVKNIGTAATHIQARAVVRATGVVHNPWTRITTTPLAAGATLDGQLPAVSWSPWLRVEVRREDNVEIRTGGRACGVGTKVWGPDGQSQQSIFAVTLGADTTLLDATVPGEASNLSYVIQPGTAVLRRPVISGIVRARTELSVGLNQVAKRLMALHPDRIFQLIISPLAGTGRAEYYQNKVWHSASVAQKATPGDGNRPDLYPLGTEPYYLWGDDVTPGSGMITDLLLKAGRDISFFMIMPSLDDSYDSKLPLRLNALYFGGDQTGAYNDGAYADNTTGAPPRYFSRTETGLVHPIHVAVQLHDRAKTVGIRTATTIRTYNNTVRPVRSILRDWALGLTGGKSGSVSHFAPDKMMETRADGLHHAFNDARGNGRLGTHFAMGLLRTAELSTYNPNVWPVTATINGGKTAIEVTIALQNGGTLITADGRAPIGWEVSTDSGTNWTIITAAAITDAAAGKVTLTGDWSAATTANIRVRYYNNDPATIVQPVADASADDTVFNAETDMLLGLMYETRADVVGAAGVPVMPYPTANSWISIT